jgi:hypothetical protein
VSMAHGLLARVQLARRDLDAARTELLSGLEAISKRPLPLVRWKLLAALGTERLRAGDGSAARQAFAEAGELIDRIAAGITDDLLRATWLASPDVLNCRISVSERPR